MNIHVHLCGRGPDRAQEAAEAQIEPPQMLISQGPIWSSNQLGMMRAFWGFPFTSLSLPSWSSALVEFCGIDFVL